MKRAVFEIKQSPMGYYYFTFRDNEEETQVVSCSFSNRAELEKCLSEVREAAPFADICTGTSPCGRPPFFWIQQEGGIVFSLVGFKKEIIFSSVSYPYESQCRTAIDKLKASSRRAAIIDLTVD